MTWGDGARKLILGLCATGRSATFWCAMNFSDFLRIERESRNGTKHYVVHTDNPKFALELVPDESAPDKIGRGVIKRLCVPNSWAGDYTQYAKYISAAQEFFGAAGAAPKSRG
jgi:hypothetical protein